jgi:hypothetical protein
LTDAAAQLMKAWWEEGWWHPSGLIENDLT